MDELGRVLYSLVFFLNKGDELVIWEVGNLLHTIGIKMCAYALSLEYNVTQWVQLPNLLGCDNMFYEMLLTPSV